MRWLQEPPRLRPPQRRRVASFPFDHQAGQRLLLPHTPNIGLTNALMASVAAHPFMDEALRSLPSYAHAWYHLSKHNTVLSSTGSTYVWALFMRWPDAEADPPADF